jgi:hypothetical protein
MASESLPLELAGAEVNGYRAEVIEIRREKGKPDMVVGQLVGESDESKDPIPFTVLATSQQLREAKLIERLLDDLREAVDKGESPIDLSYA